ncbi:MAG TPA: nucleotide kinase domain-containing protein [Ktedonobacteraceae bacterium]|nr:nucleotide kinase domain-containing protein [Ktedonobacteraceae bacterium]
MPERGKLFIMEGPDGVGKTTLTHALTEYLNSLGNHYEHFAFPGHEVGTLGYLVYDFHHNPAHFGVESVSPASLQVLHISAHIDAIERFILPTLESGRNIVLDRFWWSTWVYGKVSGISQRTLEAMLNIEFTCWNEIVPAAVFLVSSSIPHRKEEDADKWEQLCTAYYELANEQMQQYPVYMINNDHDIAETLHHILETIAQLEHGEITPKLFHDNNKKKIRLSHPAPTTAQMNLNFTTEPTTKVSSSLVPTVFTRLSPAQPTEVFDTYWRFAAERQLIFFRQLKGATPPWTTDSILTRYKFTNVYRASDRTSQYLIKHVIYNGDQSPDEVFFRILLFKIFNHIETWELLTREFGEIRYSEYSFEQYDAILTRAMNEGHTIFSAAYIMPSGGASFGYPKKHSSYLKLLERMLEDEVPSRITEMHSMRQVFELLRSYPMMGDFLAYQYATDINYSELTDFSEMDFVVPGPGAKDGIRKCFQTLGGLNETDIIQLMAERQKEEFSRLELDFRSLWGRPLQLIDCQNLFCEVGKYARLAHPSIKGTSDRKRIKQTYQGKAKLIEYWYPPKWEINHLIPERVKR